jgi:hypothetical protein
MQDSTCQIIYILEDVTKKPLVFNHFCRVIKVGTYFVINRQICDGKITNKT